MLASTAVNNEVKYTVRVEPFANLNFLFRINDEYAPAVPASDTEHNIDNNTPDKPASDVEKSND